MQSRYPLYKQLFLATLPGILLWLAWPPMPLAALSLIAFLPLLYLEDIIAREKNIDSSRRFLYLSTLTVAVWNIGVAWFLFNGPIVAGAMVLFCNTVLLTLPFYLFHLTKKRFGDKVGYPAFIMYMLAVEYLHFNWQLHWPWLTLGHSWAMFPEAIQWYEYVGVQGGSLWVLCSNVFIYLAIKNYTQAALWMQTKFKLPLQRASILAIVWVTLRPLLWIVIPLGISGLLLINEALIVNRPEIHVVVVQPNLDVYTEKFNPDNAGQITMDMLTAGFTYLDSKPDLVVFPETAIPGYTYEKRWASNPPTKHVLHFVKDLGIPLLTGIAIRDSINSKHFYSKHFDDGSCCYESYNAATLVQPDSVQVYRKAKLVAGSEYVPYPRLFGFFNQKWVLPDDMPSNYRPGTEVKTLLLDSVSIIPSICFESVFSDYMTRFVKEEPQVIAVITNDGWWGNTPGAQQHLYIAGLRAIENRRPVIRAANTGVSAIINTMGEITQSLPYGTKGKIEARIMLNNHVTFYSQHGNFTGRVAASIAVFFLLATFVRSYTKK